MIRIKSSEREDIRASVRQQALEEIKWWFKHQTRGTASSHCHGKRRLDGLTEADGTPLKWGALSRDAKLAMDDTIDAALRAAPRWGADDLSIPRWEALRAEILASFQEELVALEAHAFQKEIIEIEETGSLDGSVLQGTQEKLAEALAEYADSGADHLRYLGAITHGARTLERVHRGLRDAALRLAERRAICEKYGVTGHGYGKGPQTEEAEALLRRIKRTLAVGAWG